MVFPRVAIDLSLTPPQRRQAQLAAANAPQYGWLSLHVEHDSPDRRAIEDYMSNSELLGAKLVGDRVRIAPNVSDELAGSHLGDYGAEVRIHSSGVDVRVHHIFADAAAMRMLHRDLTLAAAGAALPVRRELSDVAQDAALTDRAAMTLRSLQSDLGVRYRPSPLRGIGDYVPGASPGVRVSVGRDYARRLAERAARSGCTEPSLVVAAITGLLQSATTGQQMQVLQVVYSNRWGGLTNALTCTANSSYVAVAPSSDLDSLLSEAYGALIMGAGRAWFDRIQLHERLAGYENIYTATSGIVNIQAPRNANVSTSTGIVVEPIDDRPSEGDPIRLPMAHLHAMVGISRAGYQIDLYHSQALARWCSPKDTGAQLAHILRELAEGSGRLRE